MIITSYFAEAGIALWSPRDGAVDVINHGRLNFSCPRNGLVILEPHTFVLSHTQRTGSVGSGELYFCSVNKNQLERRYTIEPIVPLAATNDGVYLAGGGVSGKIYVWEISSWRLLATWTAVHLKGVSCLAFSDDDSLLISGGDDGTVSVWPLLRVLDKSSTTSKLFLYRWSGHRAPVTNVVLSTGGCNSLVVSASLDQTCKIWGLGSGKLLHTIYIQAPVTSIALHPNGQLLYAGTTTGNITLCSTYPTIGSLGGICSEFAAHRSAVSALAVTLDGSSLISGSADKYVYMWDIHSGNILRNVEMKGPVTNLVIIQKTRLFNHITDKDQCFSKNRALNNPLFGNSKSSQTDIDIQWDPLVQLPDSCHNYLEDEKYYLFSSRILEKQLVELKSESTLEALQMKINIMKEKNNQACTISKEYSHEVEQLKSLYVEIRALDEKV